MTLRGTIADHGKPRSGTPWERKGAIFAEYIALALLLGEPYPSCKHTRLSFQIFVNRTLQQFWWSVLEAYNTIIKCWGIQREPKPSKTQQIQSSSPRIRHDQCTRNIQHKISKMSLGQPKLLKNISQPCASARDARKYCGQLGQTTYDKSHTHT